MFALYLQLTRFNGGNGAVLFYDTGRRRETDCSAANNYAIAMFLYFCSLSVATILETSTENQSCSKRLKERGGEGKERKGREGEGEEEKGRGRSRAPFY